MAGLLRPGNAGSDTAADHIATAHLALAQLPEVPAGTPTLIRTDYRPPPGPEVRTPLAWTDVITDALARLEALPNPG